MNVTIIANCAPCRMNAPRFCQSHTCIDCRAVSTDVEGHVCLAPDARDDVNARVARHVVRLRDY